MDKEKSCSDTDIMNGCSEDYIKRMSFRYGIYYTMFYVKLLKFTTAVSKTIPSLLIIMFAVLPFWSDVQSLSILLVYCLIKGYNVYAWRKIHKHEKEYRLRKCREQTEKEKPNGE